MSSEMYRRTIEQGKKKIADLQHDKAQKTRKAADITSRILRASDSLRRTTSSSTFKSKVSEIQRLEKDKSGVEKSIADIESKITAEQKRVMEAEKYYGRELDSEQKKREDAQKKAAQEASRQMQTINRTLSTHERLHNEVIAEIKALKQLPSKITVLFLAANPIDQTQLRLDEEARSITETVRKSKYRDTVELRSCWAVRPTDVLQAINEYNPTIVHFSGHGSDADEIVFQDDIGNAKLVTKEALVQLMKACSGSIRLVFFNTCYSRYQAQEVIQHVDAAIGMKSSIGDEAARIFASQFYSGIGFGLPIKQAFEQARALLMMESIPEEDTPELFLSPNVDAEEFILVKPPEKEEGTIELQNLL